MKAPIICRKTGSLDACECDRIEPNWSLSLKEECDFDDAERPLATAAYTDAELAALDVLHLSNLIYDLTASVNHHEANVNGTAHPLKELGLPNECERHHLWLYKQDLAYVTALLEKKGAAA